jgi:outer membrane protein OmpA-like peptidoglycan-associated protein/tetratricopeptide (TPR) repeat protein
MKKYTSTLLLIFFSVAIYAQRSESEIALREYFIDAEFFLTQEFYADALNDYLQVYKRGYKDNANVNYRIGICYLEIPGQKSKSIEYLEKASASASLKYKESSLNEKYAPIDVFLYLGNAYRVNNRLEDAIKAYKKYSELLPEDEENLHQYANKQIEACNIAMEFMSKPVGLEFKNIGGNINSSNEDYNAVVSGDGSTLVYMHKLPFYDAIYISKMKDGIWSRPDNITPQIMSDGNQYVTDISFDGKTIFLSVEDEFNSDIYISRYFDNRWSASEPIKSEINTKYWESHASISDDGNTLYFTSNRAGGIGNMDIYMATKDALGNFINVQNIKELNTELNEDTPFVTSDEKTIYFSSQGYANMGGYDIFISKKGNDGNWTFPENIGYPISTTDDDLFYFPWDKGEEAYIARIFDEGFGATDIYQLIFPSETLQAFAEKAADEEIIPSTAGTEKSETIVPTQEDQSAFIESQKDTTIIETASNEVSGKSETEPIKVEQKIAEVVKAETKSIEITPVFFEFDKSQITIAGKAELDKLVLLLNENINIHIELQGFADALGPDTYNLSLSERRAMAVMKYLISRGAAADRLKAIGKGETGFIASNTKPDGSDNPEGRKYNRRVEFEITGIDSNTLMIKRIDPVPKDLKIQAK